MVKVSAWLLQFSHNAGYGNVSTEYRMYVTDDGVPVKLDMWGRNWFSGGHWDHYTAAFYSFDANPQFPDGLFNRPAACSRCVPRCGSGVGRRHRHFSVTAWLDSRVHMLFRQLLLLLRFGHNLLLRCLVASPGVVLLMRNLGSV